MPTVKLQNGKVLTFTSGSVKKILCTCCDPECCTYPADLLGDSYLAAHLPESLTINWEGHYVGNVTKSGSSYSGGTVTLSVIDGQWTLSDSSTSTTRIVGNCLLRGNGLLVEDQFFDCYEVNWSNDEEGGGPGSAVLDRVGLCLWSNGDFSWELELAPDFIFGSNGIFRLFSPLGEFYKTSSSPTGVWGGGPQYTDLEITTCP